MLCVRWSNIDGTLLASGSDDKTIIIWKQEGSSGKYKVFGEEVNNVEVWRPAHVLNRHASDVSDLAWVKTIFVRDTFIHLYFLLEIVT